MMLPRGILTMRKPMFKEILAVASMLFGMFFGAGNLIFPASMGQMAGGNLWQAAAGLLITGVGLPLLGVAALGLSRENGLYEISCRVGRGFALFFTCALYLAIGPFFAIPRCATVSFTVGIQRILPETVQTVALLIFSFAFFAAVLFFSFNPGKILTWIGKILNPIFLFFLALLIIRALSDPLGTVSSIPPAGAYDSNAFSSGLLGGYNTMDALAGLAFGIVVVDVIRSLGVQEPREIAKNTIAAGVFSSLLMGLIYVLVMVVGAQSRGTFPIADNGGEVLAQVAEYYFGSIGAVLLAVTVTIACLKTAVGLIISCSEAFEKLFPRGPSYPLWTILFCTFSFAIANFGLDTIIAYSMPVLMFLYPLAIVLILLTLCGSFFHNGRDVLRWTIGFTAAAALFDFLGALPEGVRAIFHMNGIVSWVEHWLPLASIGFGWVCPAIAGLLIGLAVSHLKQARNTVDGLPADKR